MKPVVTIPEEKKAAFLTSLGEAAYEAAPAPSSRVPGNNEQVTTTNRYVRPHRKAAEEMLLSLVPQEETRSTDRARTPGTAKPRVLKSGAGLVATTRDDSGFVVFTEASFGVASSPS